MHITNKSALCKSKFSGGLFILIHSVNTCKPMIMVTSFQMCWKWKKKDYEKLEAVSKKQNRIIRPRNS